MNSDKTLFCKKDCRRFYVNMTTMAIKKETRKEQIRIYTTAGTINLPIII